MPKTKVALILDTSLLHRVDELVAKQRFWNRSQIIEVALKEKLERLAKPGLLRSVPSSTPSKNNSLNKDVAHQPRTRGSISSSGIRLRSMYSLISAW
jgi:Arc/MetJ-type ribon-helix-helix transcriptional regulator